MSIFYFGDFAKKIKYWTRTETVYLILLVSSMGFSIWSMLFWIIPNDIDIDTVDMVISALLICIPIIGIERNIILKANSEEEKYIDTLKEIENKEN